MDDWTRFTDYRGYEKTDRVIEWFLARLRSWPAKRKMRLLQFTTGTSRVYVNASRTATARAALRSRRVGNRMTSHAAIRTSIASTCRRTRTMRAWSANSASQTSTLPLDFSSWVVLAHRGLLVFEGRPKALGKSEE